MVQKPRADHTYKIIISMIIAVIIGVVLASFMNNAAQKLPIRQYFNQDKTNAVWDWANPNNRSDQDLQTVADFLYMHQINTVFVSIGDLINTDADKQALNKSLERYVSIMQKRGIKVFAAAGDTSWSKPENQHLPLAVQQYVFDYNNYHKDHRLDGVEFDVESYNQEHFADASMTEKELVLDEYLDMVDRLASAQQKYTDSSDDKNLELGFAIPYWFDNENKNINSVSWNGKVGPVLFHLLDRLNTLQHSNVVVMAYRNAAAGNDGIVYHARTEAEYASSNAPNVHVLIGIETTDVEPAKITFYGRSFVEMSSQVNLVNSEFQDMHAVNGIAINDLSGLEALSRN